MSNRILLLYGTRYGQTAKIAERLRSRLWAEGFDVMLANADEISLNADPVGFAGVLIGASVIRGKHQRSVRRFVTRNRAYLNDHPSAFFSVSASAAGHDPRSRADAARVLESFLLVCGWRPALTASIAGTIAYTKYPLVLRWIMKMIIRQAGGPTDTSRDHELTDWQQVDEFAAAFAERLPAAAGLALSSV